MSTELTTPLPCLVCGKALDTAANDEAFATVPHAGTQFTTEGHYGSTVFDPNFTSIDELLEINVCDACLTERQERVMHIQRSVPYKPRPADVRTPWSDHFGA